MLKLIQELFETTDRDPISAREVLLYLIEELGEVGTCLAVEAGFKDKKIEESSQEEAVDVIISALILYRKCGGDLEHLEYYFSKKAPKYRKRLDRIYNKNG